MIMFSIVVPAIRDHLYMDCYNSLNKNNHTVFEMIFVGNKPPTIPMPGNFMYIFSNESPACCIEIGARLSKGEFIITSTDDSIYSPGYLDKMNRYVRIFNRKKRIIGTRYKFNGVFKDKSLVFDKRLKNSPKVGVTVALKKKIWHDLGGIDRRFEYGLCQTDLLARFYEIGYDIHIAKDIWIDEIIDTIVPGKLWVQTGQRGRILCNKFWVKDGLFSNKRLDKVEPFPNNIIEHIF